MHLQPHLDSIFTTSIGATDGHPPNRKLLITLVSALADLSHEMIRLVRSTPGTRKAVELGPFWQHMKLLFRGPTPLFINQGERLCRVDIHQLDKIHNILDHLVI